MTDLCRWPLCVALLFVLAASGFAMAQAPKSGGTLRVAWETGVKFHEGSDYSDLVTA